MRVMLKKENRQYVAKFKYLELSAGPATPAPLAEFQYLPTGAPTHMSFPQNSRSANAESFIPHHAQDAVGSS